MTKIQENLLIVLDRVKDLAKEDEYFSDLLVELLTPWLDSLAADDFFGTERQADPRGDFRVKEWCMWSEVQ